MRVLLIGIYSNDHAPSMQNFCEMLRHGISRRGHEVRVVRPEPFVGLLSPPYPGLRKWLGYADKFLVFPGRLRRALGWAEVVHVCDQVSAIYTRYLREIPHLVTCHDFFSVRSALGEFPGARPRWPGRRYQAMIRAGLGRAQEVVCVSESTRRDVLRLTRLEPERVATIHNGFHYGYAPAAGVDRRLREMGIPADRPYVLHVGSNIWYKNRQGVLSTFLRLTRLATDRPPCLVLAGDAPEPPLQRFIEQHQLAGHVFVRQGPSNPDLQALYSGAAALLFPSFFEGFGWPVIEAQACGCPVVCSTRGSLPEVAGDGALMATVEDEETLARLLLRLLESPRERAVMIEKGFANARRFDTERMIQSYEEIYRKAVGRFSPGDRWPTPGPSAVPAVVGVPCDPAGET